MGAQTGSSVYQDRLMSRKVLQGPGQIFVESNWNWLKYLTSLVFRESAASFQSNVKEIKWKRIFIYIYQLQSNIITS